MINPARFDFCLIDEINKILVQGKEEMVLVAHPSG
jgi:hypothetical protein